jgi:DNA-binding transcriptional ArsR family regulator
MASEPVKIADELRIESIDVLKAVFDPLRMRILEAFAGQPRTVKEVAEDLGATPHRLYYHVNMLEEHGLLIVAETRMISGILEKHYKLAARHLIVAPSLLRFGTREGEEGLEILLHSVLDDTRQDVKRSVRTGVVDMEQKSPHPDSLLLRRGLARMTPEQAHDFHRRLLELLDEFATIGGSAHTHGDQIFALAMALYPTSILEDEQNETDLL